MISSSYADRHIHWLFPLPAIAFVALLMVFPVLYTTYISFTNWTLTAGTPPRFVGLDSYVAVLTEPRFLQALWRTIVFTVVAVALEGILGLASALLLNRDDIAELIALMDRYVDPGTSSWHLDSQGVWTRHHKDDDGTPLSDVQSWLLASRSRQRAALRR